MEYVRKLSYIISVCIMMLPTMILYISGNRWPKVFEKFALEWLNNWIEIYQTLIN